MLPRPPDAMARSCLARAMASAGKIRPTLGSSSRKGPGTVPPPMHSIKAGGKANNQFHYP
jgi:hypothetical protein